MTKNVLLILTILLSFINVYSQDNSRFYKQLRNAKSDNAKVAAMLKIGRWHLDRFGKVAYPKSADSTWYYAKKSEQLSKQRNLTASLGNCYAFFSEIYYRDVKYTEASDYAIKAVKTLEKTKDMAGLCLAYNTLLVAEIESVPLNTEYPSIVQKSLKLCREHNQKFFEAATIENLGFYHFRLGDLQKELDYLLMAAKIYKQLGREDRLTFIYSSIASSYSQLGNVDKALMYMQQTERILNKNKEYVIYDSFTYGSLADTYGALNKNDKAVENCIKALEVTKEYTDKNYQALSETSLLDILYETKRIDEAKVHFKNIESYLDSLEERVKADAICTLLFHSVYYDYRDKADKYANLSLKQINSKNSFLEIDRRMNSALMKYYFYIKNYEKSRLHAHNYEVMARKSNSLNRLERAYIQYAKIDSAQGDFAASMKNYKLAIKYRDSMLTEERSTEIARLETEYKTHEKENDNRLLKKQNELQHLKISKTTLEKNLSLIGILILIIGIILIYRRYKINQKIRNQINIKNATLENLLTEKEWLLKEIHHRVKNNLQVVISLLNTQLHFLDDALAREAIINSQQRIHAMSLIHKRLYQSDNIASLNMKDYIHELIAYYKIAFETGDRISFFLNLEPVELSPAQAVPLGLILNEAVSNSLKHAFPDNRKGSITIEMQTLEDNLMMLSVADNGVGISENHPPQEQSSLGMKLISGFSGELAAKLTTSNENGFYISVTFRYKLI